MKNLRAIRMGKKINQQTVADYLGVNRVTYTNYENGKRNPDSETLRRLAKFFDVSIDYLLDYNTEPQEIKTSLTTKREKLIEQISTLSEEELLEMEQITEYVKSKKEKNEQAATTA